MTLHSYKFADGRAGAKEYLLEVNPHYRNGSTSDKLNVIDARWIDIDTGLFIDITTLRRNATAEAEGDLGAMMCKDGHGYYEDDIFPLRASVFEGMPVKVPNAYASLLEEEYGRSSLTQVDFLGYHFDSASMEWYTSWEWQRRLQAEDPVVAVKPQEEYVVSVV